MRDGTKRDRKRRRGKMRAIKKIQARRGEKIKREKAIVGKKGRDVGGGKISLEEEKRRRKKRAGEWEGGGDRKGGQKSIRRQNDL